MTYTFFTYNIDFNKSNPQETKSLKSIEPKADVIGIQEAKHLDVRRALGPEFACHQNTVIEAKQGVALAWRRGKVKQATDQPNARPVKHRGYLKGVGRLGVKMLPRYINWRDLDFNGKVVRVISTHRPPQRFASLWRIFDRVLALFVKQSPYPVIIMVDSNQHTHAAFSHQSGLVWRGLGIDGFYISKSLEGFIVKGSLRRHPKVNSDHHPVSLEFEF